MTAAQQPRWTTAEVVATREVAVDVRAISLRFPAPVLTSVEGGHLDVDVVVRGRPERRSYSIVRRDPEDARVLTLGVRRSPTSRGGARYLHSLREGMTIRATQPLVTFPYTPTQRPLRFLAGGIGITALYAMTSAVARRPPAGGYLLTYAGRETSRMAFLDELAAMHGDALRIHRSAEGTPLDVPAYVASCPRDAVLYLCGPMRLMDAVRREWAAQGRPQPDCRFETFGTTGTYPTDSFVAHVPALRLEVTVGRHQSLLEALEGAGADVMYDCLKGECGLCQADVLDVHGTVDHRDVFFSADQRAANTKLCLCVSRIHASDPHRPAGVTLALP